MPATDKTNRQITIEMIAEVYQITLTDRMRFLLDTSPDLLDPLDVQRRYLLRMALVRISCPACKGIICQVSAQTGEYDTEGCKHVSDDSYACPFCHAGLTWVLDALTGQQFFDIRDLSTYRDPSAARS